MSYTDTQTNTTIEAWLLPTYDIANPTDYATDAGTPDWVKDLLTKGHLTLAPSGTNSYWEISLVSSATQPGYVALSDPENYLVLVGTTFPVPYTPDNYSIWGADAFTEYCVINP